MRFLAMLAVAAASVAVQAERRVDRSVSLPAQSRASLDASVTATIPIGVFAPADVTESLLIRVFDEANAIWAPSGIVLDWHRITSEKAAARCRMTVQIVDDDREDFPHQRGALGSIPFTADGPTAFIRLSRANAESVIRGTPAAIDATIAPNETLLGRALGRALSHELGHYLLRSKGHTRHGLMRATWPSGELLSIDRHGFELTAEERAVAERGRREFASCPDCAVTPQQ
jgi:hypothetical protein